MDTDFDFSEHMAQFDTFLIGRKIFEAMRRMGGDAESTPGFRNVVFSRTLNPADYPEVVMTDDEVRLVTELRAEPGKDIALFGGGIPWLPCPAKRTAPKLRPYEKTGTVLLEYEIVQRQPTPD